MDSIEDNNERVACGEAVSVSPAGVQATGRRPDLVEIPIRDLGPSQVVLAHRRDDDNALLAEFAAIARESLGPL